VVLRAGRQQRQRRLARHLGLRPPLARQRRLRAPEQAVGAPRLRVRVRVEVRAVGAPRLRVRVRVRVEVRAVGAPRLLRGYALK
jgi:hypothetical protein